MTHQDAGRERSLKGIFLNASELFLCQPARPGGARYEALQLN
jgi:hypothetical protein